MIKPGALKAGWVLFLVLTSILFGVAHYFQASSEKQSAAQDSIVAVLSSDQPEQFARVLAPRKFIFPVDHGPHPEYRVEWWYFTGNLQDQQQRDYGYDLTFFRFALTPEPLPASRSRWRGKQLYLAHFAVTDAARRKFYFFEKFSRAAAGLAGAESQRFHVWLHDWSAQSESAGTFPLRLKAQTANLQIDLLLDSQKPVVLQGDNGFSAKSQQPGDASYYYSYTRLNTRGVLRIDDDTIPVSGSSWLDREWSTSALAKDQLGWDWFALQLSDNSELMFYQFRKKDGQPDLNSSGSVVSPDGEKTHLRHDEVAVTVLDYWQSPHSRAVYPSRWRISLPASGVELDVVPLLEDQELNVSFRYWEGAVTVSGTKQGRPVSGKGYVELTGYRPDAPERKFQFY